MCRGVGLRFEPSSSIIIADVVAVVVVVVAAKSVVLTVATDAVANGFDSSAGFSTLGFLSPNLAFFLSNLSDPLKQISRQSSAVVLF